MKDNNSSLFYRQLTNKRTRHLEDQGYRPTVVHLAREPDTNSDDELDRTAPPGVVRYRIKTKPERNPLVTAFFRYEDGLYMANQSRRLKPGIASHCHWLNTVRTLPTLHAGGGWELESS